MIMAEKDKAAGQDRPDAEVQKRVDEETEQGFRGIETDPTPNENYTVQGVTSGKPTPETDAGAAEDARKRTADVERGDAGTL
jgi:hypothetical protein